MGMSEWKNWAEGEELRGLSVSCFVIGMSESEVVCWRKEELCVW